VIFTTAQTENFNRQMRTRI